MGFYDLNKRQRKILVGKIYKEIHSDLIANSNANIIKYFSNEDTYIRKTAYLSVGKIYNFEIKIRKRILNHLKYLFDSENPKVRQTVINSAGEIGKKYFNPVEKILEKGLFDEHHSVRNAVIGSLKKMGEKNQEPVLIFAKRFLHHDNKEVRREICHGIELFGRTHPESILPLLKELQYDKETRVKNTVIHVIGQISYKKGCLETVITDLKTWENSALVEKALKEIIVVHERYKNFAALTQKQAIEYIEKQL